MDSWLPPCSAQLHLQASCKNGSVFPFFLSGVARLLGSNRHSRQGVRHGLEHYSPRNALHLLTARTKETQDGAVFAACLQMKFYRLAERRAKGQSTSPHSLNWTCSGPLGRPLVETIVIGKGAEFCCFPNPFRWCWPPTSQPPRLLCFMSETGWGKNLNDP